MDSEVFLDILLLLLLIGLNILINYVYSNNIVFPILFSMFELFYGLTIIANNEIFIGFTMVFGILYNSLIVYERRSE